MSIIILIKKIQIIFNYQVFSNFLFKYLFFLKKQDYLYVYLNLNFLCVLKF